MKTFLLNRAGEALGLVAGFVTAGFMFGWWTA